MFPVLWRWRKLGKSPMHRKANFSSVRNMLRDYEAAYKTKMKRPQAAENKMKFKAITDINKMKDKEEAAKEMMGISTPDKRTEIRNKLRQHLKAKDWESVDKLMSYSFSQKPDKVAAYLYLEAIRKASPTGNINKVLKVAEKMKSAGIEITPELSQNLMMSHAKAKDSQGVLEWLEDTIGDNLMKTLVSPITPPGFDGTISNPTSNPNHDPRQEPIFFLNSSNLRSDLENLQNYPSAAAKLESHAWASGKAIPASLIPTIFCAISSLCNTDTISKPFHCSPLNSAVLIVCNMHEQFGVPPEDLPLGAIFKGLINRNDSESKNWMHFLLNRIVVPNLKDDPYYPDDSSLNEEKEEIYESDINMEDLLGDQITEKKAKLVHQKTLSPASFEWAIRAAVNLAKNTTGEQRQTSLFLAEKLIDAAISNNRFSPILEFKEYLSMMAKQGEFNKIWKLIRTLANGTQMEIFEKPNAATQIRNIISTTIPINYIYSIDTYEILLEAYSKFKDATFLKADMFEHFWRDMVKRGIHPSNSCYSSKIRLYGKLHRLSEVLNTIKFLEESKTTQIDSQNYKELAIALMIDNRPKAAYDVKKRMEMRNIPISPKLAEFFEDIKNIAK